MYRNTMKNADKKKLAFKRVAGGIYGLLLPRGLYHCLSLRSYGNQGMSACWDTLGRHLNKA